MSFQTWEKLYYPIPAQSAMGSDLDAARHSLTKWQGLRADVLKNHELRARPKSMVIEGKGGHLTIDMSSCAMCLRAKALFLTGAETDEVADEDYEGFCAHCVGFRGNNGASCDSPQSELDPCSPYHEFYEFREPESMIAWLENAVEQAEKEAAKEAA